MMAWKQVLIGSMIVSSFVGCGPEVVAIATLTTHAAALVGAVGGTVWLVKSIENVSLDTEKKKLEIRALQDGVRVIHEVDLSDDQYREIKRTGKVQLGESVYEVR